MAEVSNDSSNVHLNPVVSNGLSPATNAAAAGSAVDGRIRSFSAGARANDFQSPIAAADPSKTIPAPFDHNAAPNPAPNHATQLAQNLGNVQFVVPKVPPEAINELPSAGSLDISSDTIPETMDFDSLSLEDMKALIQSIVSSGYVELDIENKEQGTVETLVAHGSDIENVMTEHNVGLDAFRMISPDPKGGEAGRVIVVGEQGKRSYQRPPLMAERQFRYYGNVNSESHRKLANSVNYLKPLLIGEAIVEVFRQEIKQVLATLALAKRDKVDTRRDQEVVPASQLAKQLQADEDEEVQEVGTKDKGEAKTILQHVGTGKLDAIKKKREANRKFDKRQAEIENEHARASAEEKKKAEMRKPEFKPLTGS